MASCAGAPVYGGACAGVLRGLQEKEMAERQRLKAQLAEQLSSDLLRLLKEEIQADVTFWVGRVAFRAHRAVLLARVPDFYSCIVGKDFNNVKNPETVKVMNCEPSDFKTFLHIIYSSDRNIKEDEENILNTIQNGSELTLQDEHVIPFNNFHNKEETDMQSPEIDGCVAMHNNYSNVNVAGNPLPSALHKDIKEIGHGKEMTIVQDDFELEPASKLGEDLLSIYKKCCCPDLAICIGEYHFQAHRAILCARSSYFAAMLSGCWAESSQEQILLKGISQVEMNAMMHFIYGGTLDFANKADIGQMLSVADMYGLEGLKEVAIYVLKRDFCKFFHKPVAGIQQAISECLLIAYSLGVESLQASCMRWIVKHFVKSWCEKSFANLPDDLQRNCLTALIKSLNHKNAALLLMESDKLISSLPRVKWAEKALSMALQLQDECVTFIVGNFSQIIKSESFYNLLQAQGMSSTPYLLEHVFSGIEKSISFENSCLHFIALEDLKNLVSANEMDFTCKIQALCDKLWIFLVQSFYAVRHTEGWKLMRPDDQQKIQAAAVDKGDDRMLGKKPIFSSSQQYRGTKSSDIKNSNKKAERKVNTWNRSSFEKMKSDGLGASGHTSNRNSSFKVSKHDDIKSNDGKKAMTKTTKDAKSVEKTATTKSKTVMKPKTENANSKTESLTPKQESEKPLAASLQRDLASTKGTKSLEGKNVGARPKILPSIPSLQVKTTSVKKPASSMSSARISKKSDNSSKDTLLSNECSEEAKDDILGHEQKISTNKRPSACSPHARNMSKINMDCSEDDVVAVKSKLSMKISNGVAPKKKVNENGHNGETCSMMKPPNGKGCNEQNPHIILKKKSNMNGNGSTQQRTKSAPPILVKKQGSHGDTTSTIKSAASLKQNEEKSPVKHFDSAYLDRHIPSKKNNLKPAHTPATKINEKPVMPSSTHQLSKKGENASKELKHKCIVGQPTSKPQSPAQRHLQRESIQRVKHSIVPKVGCNQSLVEKPKPHTLASPGLYPLGNDKSPNQCEEGSDNSLLINDEPDLILFQSNPQDSASKIEIMQNKLDDECCHCQVNMKSTPVLHTVINSKKGGMNKNEMKYPVDENDGQSTATLHYFTKGCINNTSSDESKERIQDMTEQKDKLNCDDSNNPGTSFSSRLTSTSTSVYSGKNVCRLHFEGFVNGSLSDGSGLADHEFNSEELNEATECLAGRVLHKVMLVSPKEMDTTETPESHDNSEIPIVAHWTRSTGIVHQKESPESDSASATTSSDDIKPRSEDYDAGGSQDDDGSNERGISKCSTMLCHDFLGRSSSDTSTPEELKVYDSNLRIEVKMKKESCADCFRINSTSDDEGPRKKCDIWPHQENITMDDTRPNENASCLTAQFTQEVEQVSSSADETEDEKSEADHAAEHCPSDITAQPFQGIVNLAFDDTTENDVESQEFPSATKFKRSVLLSVDECEELGSDEGEAQTPMPRSMDSLTPSDVFDCAMHDPRGSTYSRYSLEIEDGFIECSQQEKEKSERLEKCARKPLDHHCAECVGQTTLGVSSVTEENGANEILSVVETPCHKEDQKINSKTEEIIEFRQYNRHSDNDLKSQERPCHLDLNRRDSSSDRQQYSSAKAIEHGRSQLLTHDDQGKENNITSTENSKTALTAGDIDDCDTLAQTCMFDRPSKTLSPIYEMDVGDAIEQRMEDEAHILGVDFEDQHFAERDWTLLRHLLSDQESNLDVKNSVPADFSLAQYLISQTLLLARDSSKPQGKAHIDTFGRWTELMSPPDDSSASVTMTSFSSDCSSPYGEWTILELETQH